MRHVCFPNRFQKKKQCPKNMEHIIGLSGLRPEHCCGWTRRNLAMLRCQAKALLILLLYIFLLFHMESTCNYLPKTLYRHVAWFFQTIFFLKTIGVENLASCLDRITNNSIINTNFEVNVS